MYNVFDIFLFNSYTSDVFGDVFVVNVKTVRRIINSTIVLKKNLVESFGSARVCVKITIFATLPSVAKPF